MMDKRVKMLRNEKPSDKNCKYRNPTSILMWTQMHDLHTYEQVKNKEKEVKPNATGNEWQWVHIKHSDKKIWMDV